MELLKQYIKEQGKVLDHDILKADAFLNHQIDVTLLQEIGKEFYNYFKDKNITKILTIESSGIAIASIAAIYFNVPVVFAKKAESINLDGEMIISKVESYTKKKSYSAIVSKKFISPDDNILILDDFLALGSASLALVDIVKSQKANIAGIGIVIEKSYQSGITKLKELDLDVYSLARIKSMSKEHIEYLD